VLSGVGGWAGIGLAAGLTDPTAGLGAVGGYAALSNYNRARRQTSRCSRCRSELIRTLFRRVELLHVPERLSSNAQGHCFAQELVGGCHDSPRGIWRVRFSPKTRSIQPRFKSEDGKYLDKEGSPTFKIASDGTVDWYTYSGYRRYHSECHVCHGPTVWAPPTHRR